MKRGGRGEEKMKKTRQQEERGKRERSNCIFILDNIK